jgi:hypothetical protein
MIGGRFVVAGRKLRTADTDEIVSQAQAAADRIWDAAGLAPPGAGLDARWPLRAGARGRGAAHA